MKACYLGCAAVLVLSLSPAVARAQDDADPNAAEKTRALMNDIYGQRISEAERSAHGDDDLQLAAELIDAAAKEVADPALVRLMLEKAHALSHDIRDGYATAAKALDRLIARFPDRAQTYQPQLIDVYQRWFNAARGPEQQLAGRKLVAAMIARGRALLEDDQMNDAELLLRRAEIYARRCDYPDAPTLEKLVQSVRDRKRTQTQVRSYTARVEANPKDEAAHAELFRLHLVELGDPNRAMAHLDHAPSEQARQLAPFAAKAVDQVPSDKLLPLGDWYRSLSHDASERAKLDMLQRAKACYTQYLKDQPGDGPMGQSHAALALRQINQVLGLVEEPEPERASMSDWIRFAASRERQSPERQVELIKQAMQRANQMPVDVKAEYDNHRITAIDLAGNPDIESIMPLYGLALERLSLRGCKRIQSINVLRGMPLKSLNLDGCQSLRSIAVLEEMPLEALNLGNCWNLRGDLSVLQGKPLTELNLAGCDGLESLQGIEGMPLQRLNLAHCRNITGHLERCKGMKLQFLDVSHCKKLTSTRGVDPAALHQVRAIATSVVGDDLAGIAHLRPRELDISWNGGVSTLKPLLRMPLVTLRAHGLGHNLKDSDWMMLRQIPTLNALHIHDVKVKRMVMQGK